MGELLGKTMKVMKIFSMATANDEDITTVITPVAGLKDSEPIVITKELAAVLTPEYWTTAVWEACEEIQLGTGN